MECFKVFANEIEGRIDPYYHSKIFKENEKQIKSSKFGIKTLKQISKKIVDGPFGSQLKVEEYVSEGIPLIRVKNIKNEELQEEGFVYITREKQNQLKRSKVKPNDVILTKAGSIGNACLFPTHLKEANITSHLAKIEVKDEINPIYLCKYLNTKFGQLQIFREGNKTTRPELNLSEVSSILIILPPIDIQNKIVQLMDDAYKIKKQNEAEAKQLLNSINDYVLDELGIKLPELKDKMTYCVTSEEIKDNRIDAYYFQPKFDEVEKAIKKGKFGVKKLKDFIRVNAKLENIKNYAEINYVDLASINKNFGTIQEINKLTSKEAPSRARQKLEKGDLLLSSLSGSLKSIAVFDKSESNFIASTGFYIIKNSNSYNNYYLFALFRSFLYQLLLHRETTGAIMSSINKGQLNKLKIPLPPLSVQNKIAEEVKKRMQKAEQLQKEAKENLEKAKQEVEKIVLE